MGLEERQVGDSVSQGDALHQNSIASVRLSQESLAEMMNVSQNTIKGVFRGGTMVTTTAAAFMLHPQVRPPTLNWGVGPAVAYEGAKLAAAGRVVTGLGTAFAANYAIDKVFFDDTPVRGGGFVGDLIAPVGIVSRNLPWKVKAPLLVAAHVGGKLLDKYA